MNLGKSLNHLLTNVPTNEQATNNNNPTLLFGCSNINPRLHSPDTPQDK